ncbi:hypothetical protein [Kitasatospora sp. LaBMicrA B282]|uniref:hypothetical protein n=1 Tax=Kitasatospora sp. LaBMicrA B282 TaxID=3420949 RepID=UPI003D0C8F40
MRKLLGTLAATALALTAAAGLTTTASVATAGAVGAAGAPHATVTTGSTPAATQRFATPS